MKHDSKQELADWMAAAIQSYGRLHDHKETMAWVATALYLPGILYLAAAARTATDWKFAAIGLILIITALVFLFAWAQLTLRWRQHCTVLGLQRAMADLYSRKRLKLKVDNTIGSLWPEFVEDHIQSAQDDRPDCVSTCAVWFPFRGNWKSARWLYKEREHFRRPAAGCTTAEECKLRRVVWPILTEFLTSTAILTAFMGALILACIA